MALLLIELVESFAIAIRSRRVHRLRVSVDSLLSSTKYALIASPSILK